MAGTVKTTSWIKLAAESCHRQTRRNNNLGTTEENTRAKKRDEDLLHLAPCGDTELIKPGTLI
ncbi:hypothetical protein GCM10022414_27750 [Zhongshania borealis]|uniref:Uncharacterized protein n=1 Tax=Zhongshania borealis TaxID=889488 RepID=A0ABP7X0J4_9GAMM